MKSTLATCLSAGAALAVSVLLSACGSSSNVQVCAAYPAASTSELTVTNSGRRLTPAGRITSVGDLPTGGTLTPDGRFYWAVDSGDGRDDVQIVALDSGAVVQVLSLPGAFGQAAFAPDGHTAYVSGEPLGGVKPLGPTMGNSGDVIHVFTVDPATGQAKETTPIVLPAPTPNTVTVGLPPSAGPTADWPAGLAVTPDGKTLVVALTVANQAALIDLASGKVSVVAVGKFPLGVAIERSGHYAYIGNELDGTLSKIDLTTAKVTATVAGLGGALGDSESHVQGLLADPARDRIYAAVANRDAVAVIDTSTDTVAQIVSLKRPEGYGTQPVALALTPDGKTLYAADAGEDALAAIALTPRGSYQTYDVIGKVPTGSYPHDVQVTPDGCGLLWTAAKGFNAGPNSGYQTGGQGIPFENQSIAPYGTYILDMLLGKVGLLALPSDAQLVAYASRVAAQILPANTVPPPAATPLQGPDGGPSQQIKYVFLVVRENRTYDQIFGTDPRGEGAANLEVFDDNGVSGPTGGMTPNAHALSRMFSLLDNFYEDSEVSKDGHLITTGAYAIDYMQRVEHPQYSGRGGPDDTDGNPVEFPPTYALFDLAARQGVSFRNYGEFSGGSTPVLSNDGRGTYNAVIASLDPAYSPVFGCATGSDPLVPNTPSCSYDSGMGVPPPLALSRIDEFRADFALHLQAGTVPQFSYITLPNDHTNGTGAGLLTPQALVADNDLALGQLVQIISTSSIWPQSAIFVVEDDSQDGADHVDAHRAPAFVISPWAVHGGQLVHTHYDQYSMIRSIEAILGLKPQYLNDANAVPMYDAFTTTANNAAYQAILPRQSLVAKNTAASANAAWSARLPWSKPDVVPQEIADRIIWQAVFGAQSTPPRPGPHASAIEHRRARAYLSDYEQRRRKRIG